MPDDAIRSALVNGKAVLINNCWWQVARRDDKADKVALVVSKYAAADGFKNQKPKLMSLTALVNRIRSGKWGANINGRRYGPQQDAKVRDNVRKSNGLSAAPGAAKFRKATNEAELLEARPSLPVVRYLGLLIAAEDAADDVAMEAMGTNDHEASEASGVAWAHAYLQWLSMTDAEQTAAFTLIENGTYRTIMGAPPRGVGAEEREPTVSGYGVTFRRAGLLEARTHQPGRPVPLTKLREAALRKRGFTYRKNPDAPPAKLGYPPMVRRWAADEGFPLPAMQRMWDSATEDIDTNELDKPQPGDRSASAHRFYSSVVGVFKGMVATRRRLEAAG